MDYKDSYIIRLTEIKLRTPDNDKTFIKHEVEELNWQHGSAINDEWCTTQLDRSHPILKVVVSSNIY